MISVCLFSYIVLEVIFIITKGMVKAMDDKRSRTNDESNAAPAPTSPDDMSSGSDAADADTLPDIKLPNEPEPETDDTLPDIPMPGEAGKPPIAGKPPKADKSDTSGKSGKTENTDTSDISANKDKSDKSINSDKPDKSDNQDKPDKAEKSDKPEKAGKPDKAENQDKPDKTKSTDKSDTTADSSDWKRHLPPLLTVSPSPHIRTEDTTRSIMIDVCIALMPALIWAIFVFGFRALTLTLISVVFAVLSEFAYPKLTRRQVTISDFSAVVTGILLAFNLPVAVPLWMPAVGAIFAIIVVKQLFGGIGKNFINPALAARVFLLAWPAHMSAFTSPGEELSPIAISVSSDAVASATPLASLKNGTIPKTSLFDMIIGYEGGCIGEVSALLLTAGFIYLLYRRVITWHIPVAYIGTVLALTILFSKNSLTYDFALGEIFSGGLFLGAIFMATDYTTSPVTVTGRLIYGVGCGLLTVFIRYFGGYPEGVSFSILIMNLLVWYLDRYTKPLKFGGAANGKAGKESDGK